MSQNVVERRGEERLGRPRRRWEDNMKMYPQKWHGDMDWIGLA
jgi:hypothetical protein